MAESLIGTYIGRYKIEEMIGRGGMAEVFKAYQVNLDRFVAIKIMHKFLAEDKDFLIRFEREARAMAATKHPNIVDVYDFDVDKNYYYIVMDYLSEGTLKNRIDRVTLEGGIIDIDKAIRIILEVCDALAFAHKRGMIHRDIKPANIMFNEHGAAVLTDFGIARMVNSTSNTTTGSMIGTPAYMSPEQGLGEPGDNRSDIYSLGVLSYHLLTGQLPHEGDTPLSVVLKHINETPVKPSKINPHIPSKIEAVLMKALEKNPDERYETISEMGRELRLAAQASSDVNTTGEIPLDLLKIEQAAVSKTDSLALPGTENLSLIDSLAQTPYQAELTNEAETQMGSVPTNLKNLFRENVSVEDAQMGSDSEMTHFEIPEDEGSSTPTKMVNIQADLPGSNDSGFNEFDLNLLPKEYDIDQTHMAQNPNAVELKEPNPQPSTRDEMAQQTRQLLDTLDFDKQGNFRDLVKENQAAQARQPLEKGAQIDLLPDTDSKPAPQPEATPSETPTTSTGQFVGPERQYDIFEEEIDESIDMEAFQGSMETFYDSFEDDVSATKLDVAEKKVRVKPSKEAILRRRERTRRVVGNVLSFVFLLLGIGLGYAIYDYAFVEKDGPSLVAQFNDWLNVVSGGETLNSVALDGLEAEAPLRQNGHSRANVNNSAVALIVTDVDEIPSEWATVIEVQAENNTWVPVSGFKTLFNSDGEAVWPLDASQWEDNRLYRWRVYHQADEASEIVSSGPFVLPNAGAIYVFEVSAGPAPAPETAGN